MWLIVLLINETNSGTIAAVTLKANFDIGFKNPTVHGIRSVVGSNKEMACETVFPKLELPRMLPDVVCDVVLPNVYSVVDETAATHGKAITLR